MNIFIFLFYVFAIAIFTPKRTHCKLFEDLYDRLVRAAVEVNEEDEQAAEDEELAYGSKMYQTS